MELRQQIFIFSRGVDAIGGGCGDSLPFICSATTLGFDFAGCVNITHRAPKQFSYRYGRKINPSDEFVGNTFDKRAGGNDKADLS